MIAVFYHEADSSEVARLTEFAQHQGVALSTLLVSSTSTESFEQVQQVVESSDSALVLWSRNSADSKAFRSIALFVKARTRVTSVMLEDLNPPIWYRFGQRINLYDEPRATDYQTLWQSPVEAAAPSAPDVEPEDRNRFSTPTLSVAVVIAALAISWAYLDEMAWSEARKSDSVEAYETYLNRWLPTAHRQDAEERLVAKTTHLVLDIEFEGAERQVADVQPWHFFEASDWERLPSPTLLRMATPEGTNLADIQYAAQRGDPEAALLLGFVFELGAFLNPQEPDRAKALFEVSCELAVARACGALGVLVATESESDTEHLQGLQLLDDACTAGVLRACLEYGYQFLQRAKNGAEPDRGVQYLEPHCEEGVLEACHSIARIITDRTDWNEQDDIRGESLYRTNCELGVADSCNNLAILMTASRGGLASNGEEELKLFMRACHAGSWAACGNAAERLFQGDDDVDKNYDMSLEYATTGCRYGLEGFSCFRAAYLHYEHTETEESIQQAVRIYELICDHDQGSGCGNLGWHYMYQDDPQVQDQALPLLEKACESNDYVACRSLGLFFLNGYGSHDIDYGLAIQWLTKSCEGDEATGCGWLTQIYDGGMGVPADRDTAVSYARRTLALDGDYSYARKLLERLGANVIENKEPVP